MPKNDILNRVTPLHKFITMNPKLQIPSRPNPKSPQPEIQSKAKNLPIKPLIPPPCIPTTSSGFSSTSDLPVAKKSKPPPPSKNTGITEERRKKAAERNTEPAKMLSSRDVLMKYAKNPNPPVQKKRNENSTKIVAEILRKNPQMLKGTQPIKLKLMEKTSLGQEKVVIVTVKMVNLTDGRKSIQIIHDKNDKTEEPMGEIDPKGPFNCLSCKGKKGKNLQFKSYYECRTHHESLHGVPFHRLSCDRCGVKFTKKIIFLHHRLVKHSIPCDDYVFPKCPHCKYVGIYDWNIERHVKMKHKKKVEEKEEEEEEKEEKEEEESAKKNKRKKKVETNLWKMPVDKKLKLDFGFDDEEEEEEEVEEEEEEEEGEEEESDAEPQDVDNQKLLVVPPAEQLGEASEPLEDEVSNEGDDHVGDNEEEETEEEELGEEEEDDDDEEEEVATSNMSTQTCPPMTPTSSSTPLMSSIARPPLPNFQELTCGPMKPAEPVQVLNLAVPVDGDTEVVDFSGQHPTFFIVADQQQNEAFQMDANNMNMMQQQQQVQQQQQMPTCWSQEMNCCPTPTSSAGILQQNGQFYMQQDGGFFVPHTQQNDWYTPQPFFSNFNGFPDMMNNSGMFQQHHHQQQHHQHQQMIPQPFMYAPAPTCYLPTSSQTMQYSMNMNMGQFQANTEMLGNNEGGGGSSSTSDTM